MPRRFVVAQHLQPGFLFVSSSIHDHSAVGRLGDVTGRVSFIGQLNDLACIQVHAEQIITRVLMGEPVLARGTIGAKDDFVLVRVERVLGKVQVDTDTCRTRPVLAVRDKSTGSRDSVVEYPWSVFGQDVRKS